jgi:hypothetical protein
MQQMNTERKENHSEPQAEALAEGFHSGDFSGNK